jgi:carboxypeptidase Q
MRLPVPSPCHAALAVAALVTTVAVPIVAQAPAPGRRQTAPPDPTLVKLREAATADTRIWERLEILCDRVGPRIAGSAPYQAAVRWAEAAFREDGQEGVRTEPVKVNLWVRGRERAAMTVPVQRELPMLGLGDSVGTPGLEAAVAVVHSFEELGPQVRGKIVLFDPQPPAGASAGALYGIFVRFRGRGASEAAGAGAVAMLLRSMPPTSLATAHTGAMRYDPAKPKIPAAAIPSEYAEWIARLAAAGIEVRVRLEMEAHEGGTVEAPNVVAEIRGSAKPEEVVVIGGHLDSWDVGQGAQDDGAGVVEAIETLRLIRGLGTPPRRTIRTVLFANVEHGLDGGKAYAEAHKAERHMAAVESDLGTGKPERWGISGTPVQLAWFLTVAQPVGLPVEVGGGGADISPLADQGVLLAGLYPNAERYFEIHHTDADTLDKVDPALLREGLTAVATLAWQLANTPAP